MNQGQDSSNERTEKLLRRWGAEEAARGVKLKTAPAPRPAGRPGTGLLRWGPLTAAAGLLVAAGVIFWQAKQPGRKVAEPPPAARSPGGPTAPDATTELKDELAKVRAELNGELAEVRGELAQARSELSAAVEASRLALRQWEKSGAEVRRLEGLLSESRRQADELRRTVKAKDQQLAELTAKLDQAGEEIAELRRRSIDARKRLDDQGRELTAANTRIAHLTESEERSRRAQRKAEEQLATVTARHEAIVHALQQAYLVSAAPGALVGGPAGEMMGGPASENELVVRQTALRRKQLLPRCARVRASVTDDSAKRLVETLEAVLTRLDMLVASDAVAAGSFRALLRQHNLPEQIDDVLTTTNESREVQAWLVEARLILTGAASVG